MDMVLLSKPWVEQGVYYENAIHSGSGSRVTLNLNKPYATNSFTDCYDFESKYTISTEVGYDEIGYESKSTASMVILVIGTNYCPCNRCYFMTGYGNPG